MKKTYSILAAALITAGALLTTACSGDDNDVIDDITPTTGTETIQFTATLAPKGDDGDNATRAITTGKDANNKEILNVTWRENEQVFIYYETTNGHASTTATVKSVDETTGVATITAEFDANAKPDGTAKFVYPASLATTTGDIDESKLLNNQNGLLRTGITSISQHFDAATATGSISVADGTASVKGNIAMQNQVCICKFVLRFSDDGDNTTYERQGATTLTIAVGGGRTYTISSPFEADSYGAGTNEGQTDYRPFQSGDAIYVAMLPFESQSLTFRSGAYRMTTSGSLAAGKFYRNVPVTLVYGTRIDLSEGSILAYDGDIITQSGDATTNTITIDDGATVTINGVNISTGGAGITCQGTATIILVGQNTILAGRYGINFPAILAGPRGTTLTIRGSGSLTATGGEGSAGIGSVSHGTCGNITISGGTVTATGGSSAAGIGSGDHGTCGNITISGGTVTATGGALAAGIGSGLNGSCGHINIASTVTRVTAIKGADAPYSIGTGANGTCSGTFNIGGTDYYVGHVFQNGGDTYLATSPLVYPLSIANVNKLIYSYIPITNAQGIAIVNGSTQINSLFDTAIIEQNKEVTEGSIVDNNSQTDYSDEITITSPESGYFIQLFMLSNVDHKVVNYLIFAGTEYKSDIETQRYGNDNPNTIYTDNSYSYDGEEYKLMAILRRGDSNNLLLIQEIQ